MSDHAPSAQDARRAHGMISEDNPLRLYIASRSRTDILHVVELDKFGGSGECSCEHFFFGIGPGIRKRLIKPNTEAAWCQHIRDARAIVADMAIRAISARQNRNRTPQDYDHDHEDQTPQTQAKAAGRPYRLYGPGQRPRGPNGDPF